MFKDTHNNLLVLKKLCCRLFTFGQPSYFF